MSGASVASAAQDRLASGDASPGAGRSALGRAMTAIGIVGVVGGLVLAGVSLVQVPGVQETADRSVELTAETLDVVADSIALSASTVDSLSTTVDSVRAVLVSVRDGIDAVGDALGSVSDVTGGSLADSLESVSSVLPTIETSAGAIDDALSLLDATPFLDGYDPAVPLDQSIADLRESIDPLVTDLRDLDTQFADVTDALDDVSERVDATIASVDAIAEQVSASDTLFERYRTSVADARALADEYDRDVDRGFGWLRWLGVLGGLFLAVSQVVPLWLGAELRRRVEAEPAPSPPVTPTPP